MNLKKGLLLVVATALLAACAAQVPVVRQQIAQLSAGATRDEVESVLAGATPTAVYSLDTNNRNFEVRHYSMQTGVTTSFIPVCTPICYTVPVTVPVTVPYVVVVDAQTQKLFAWGTIEELSKSPDNSISEIMPALKDAYAVAIAKKR